MRQGFNFVQGSSWQMTAGGYMYLKQSEHHMRAHLDSIGASKDGADNFPRNNRFQASALVVFAPSYVEKSGVAALPVSQLTRRLSAMRRLSFLLLLMITSFKQQVFVMVPRIARRSSRFFMTTLIHRIPK